MARLAALLRAAAKSASRNGKTLGSFTGNNLFYIALALLFMSDSEAFVSLNVILLVTLFFPMSTDPMRKLPASRLGVWPVTKSELRGLRLITPWLNPITWVLAVLVLIRTVSWGLWATLAGMFVFGFVAPSLRIVPRGKLFPLPSMPGKFRHLVRINLRQMLSTLDFYCALMLAIGAAVYRWSGRMPEEARIPMTLLIVLALSSYAQSLFGLDGPGARTRYRLLPVRGWQIVAVKNAVFVVMVVVLCLPLAPLPALSGALTAVAVGNQHSMESSQPQERWRFTAATGFGRGIIQVILTILATTATAFASPFVVFLCAALCAASIHRSLDQL